MSEEHFHGVIEITSSGMVEVAPDEAVVELRVIVEAKTATAAVADNAKRTKAVVDVVSAQPNHGVTTEGSTVSPLFRYDPATSTSTIVGYRATSGVNVETKVDYAGRIFDAGIEAGANQSSGIVFRVQNEGPHQEEALRLAVKSAYAEARTVADTAKIDLQGPETVQIDPGAEPVLLRTVALDADTSATPTIPGNVMISRRVRIVFRTRVQSGHPCP